MSEKRELFADIIVGIMTGDKDFVWDKLVLLDPAELDHLAKGSEWVQAMCAEIKGVDLVKWMLEMFEVGRE